MKTTITTLFIFFTTIVFSQTKIGEINGDYLSSYFGHSVSMSRDGVTVAVGGHYSIGKGYVKIYEISNNQLVQKGQMLEGANESRFGQTVKLSADGNILAVHISNEANYVQVYEYANNEWGALGNPINIGRYNGWGDISLSSDGKTVALSEIYDNSQTGKIQVYNFNGADWVQKGQDLLGDNANDYFGWNVSLASDGNRLISGSGKFSENYYLKVYDFINGVWSMEQSIELDHNPLSTTFSENAQRFAVGLPYYKSDNRTVGKIEVYDLSNGSWSNTGTVLGDHSAWSTYAIDIQLTSDGNKMIVGSKYGGSNNDGEVLILEYQNVGREQNIQKRNSGNWTNIYEIEGSYTTETLGSSASISGDGNSFVIGTERFNGDTGRAEAYSVSEVSLPISLKDFSAYAESDDVIVSWSTMIEYNNSHFNLQKSIDGKTFRTIAKIDSKNINSNVITEYRYVDRFIDKSNDMIYYRLEQIDMDGIGTFYDAISISFKDDVYDFPTVIDQGDDLFLKNVNTFSLYDMNGKHVKTSIDNRITTESINKGWYLIVNEKFTSKVLVR